MLFFEIYMFKFLERKQEKVVFSGCLPYPPKKKNVPFFDMGIHFPA